MICSNPVAYSGLNKDDIQPVKEYERKTSDYIKCSYYDKLKLKANKVDKENHMQYHIWI